ncbi:SGNH hydrolase [Lophium mytilinum]|uniref:SGNH hydrolase n=1 Tax=Lophium mytilinum TaxID=390894 RepID=A0A6A6RAU3_9PEZI|nr:SGNH hydrolase [Lophium mytilinum]
MLSVIIALFLSLFSTTLGAALPSHRLDKRMIISKDATDALIAANVDVNRPHIRPSQKVEEILGIGDSYSAGIGSNGDIDSDDASSTCHRFARAWPMQLRNSDSWLDFNIDKPKLTFGACSGGVMKDLRDNQLQQGVPNPADVNLKIGKPQVAVLTIAGNDAQFSNIVNDCIYRFWFPKDCNTRLTEVEEKIRSPEFKKEIMDTYALIIGAGRDAGGANPSESFQAFVGGYVQFWNHDDPICDQVFWNRLWGTKLLITRELRKRMNDLADSLNSVLKSAANELQDFGVFYVEGYQSDFSTHRFCEPHDLEYHQHEDIGSSTWFWSYHSPYEDGNEGPTEDKAPVIGTDVFQDLLDVLIPDKAVQQTINDDNPPWNINEAFSSQEALLAAYTEATAGANPPKDPKPDDVNAIVKRVFHPKGTALTQFSDHFMQEIRNHRDEIEKPGPPYEPGMCTVHVREYQSCGKNEDSLSAEVEIRDNSGTVVGTSEGRKAINDNAPLRLSSKLPQDLVITGEHQGDYVQFTYGSLHWTSGDKKDGDDDDAYCILGDWDPRSIIEWINLCETFPNALRDRQMDCWFKCDYSWTGTWSYASAFVVQQTSIQGPPKLYPWTWLS